MYATTLVKCVCAHALVVGISEEASTSLKKKELQSDNEENAEV